MNYTNNIKVEVRGKKYAFPLRVNARCAEQSRDAAENACRGITYRIDVQKSKRKAEKE